MNQLNAYDHSYIFYFLLHYFFRKLQSFVDLISLHRQTEMKKKIKKKVLYSHLHVHAASQRHNNKDRRTQKDAGINDA